MYKRVIFLLNIFLFMLFLPSVLANFACGEITGNHTPAWLTVDLNYRENPLFKTKCEVSPINNKYCCDPRAINGVSWSRGKTLDARILDQSGYFTDVASLNITGEGFDLFAPLELKKSVSIVNATPTLTLNNGQLELNFVSSLPFILTNYSLIHNGIETVFGLCNCTSQSVLISNTSSGDYKIKVGATDGQNTFYESKNFTLLDFLFITRSIECPRCRNNFVPSNTNVNFKIIVNSSHSLDMILEDNFPKDWRYNGSEEINFGETHNSIRWQVNGTSISRNYSLYSPSVLIRRYSFISVIDSFKDTTDRVIVYRIHPFLRFLYLRQNGFSESQGFNINNVRNGPDNPLVLYLDDEFVSEIAIFPNELKYNSDISFKPVDKTEDSIYDFIIQSNIRQNQIEYVYIKLRVNKELIEGENLSPKDLNIYSDNDVLYEQELVRLVEDNNYYYYEIKLKSKGKYKLKWVR